MSDRFYLIDNNALLDLGAARRATKFFKQNCRVTDDVAHEAGGRARSLPPPIKKTTSILEHLVQIMGTLEPTDTDLVDLYHNTGAADPGMIATALALRDEAQDSLFPEEWIVVSRDKAVMALAVRYEVPRLGPQELSGIIDAALDGLGHEVGPTT